MCSVSKDVFLTIIVSAYNVDAYVGKCLQSLVHADLGAQIEVLIVLGNSSDTTNLLCEQSKFCCIYQDGQGLSDAKNIGIRKARGKYLTFIDADDYIDPVKFKEFLMEFMEWERSSGNEVKILVNDFYFADKDQNVVREQNQIDIQRKKFVNYTYLNKILKKRGSFWNSWRIIYQREYLLKMNLFFLEHYTSEDLEHTVRLLTKTGNVFFCHMPYYNYCPIRDGSLANVKSLKSIGCFIDVISDSIKNIIVSDVMDQKTKRLFQKRLLKEWFLNLPDIFLAPERDKKSCINRNELFIKTIKHEQCIHFSFYLLVVKMCSVKFVAYILYKVKIIRRMHAYGEGKCYSQRRENR